ncbi:DUF1624 domain-containing protein [Pseudemcibacter aquimaris]|uniref:DUF1624 domain-containing protein n=1 Tax=Pseudemcibacter aquimaris TaxID=2857064 RepID=UPI002013BBF3|nr:heparan-alpha-glucosaminide N-acetyltransferase domain-containing protein [Pseudemcibacter aquimaris]MCC3861408.1 heparan-alpha-glucosaminide N-acetyltransferase domain-containing protein [Pseudemcibacter aquimaris]WDU58178.1 DUF1624 domain-containing protein [Pseudemcibacter aquimaris]
MLSRTLSQSTERNINANVSSGSRLVSIDALRGFVMVIMLIDHIRETFYLHLQVSDPVDVYTTSPALFYTRFASAICAPVFIWLTGLSAYLYAQRHTKNETAAFLLKRGLFLIFLELTVVVFLWAGKYPPNIFYLQVIWCIGFCMISLAGLIYLPRKVILMIGIAIVAGHNLLDGFKLDESSPFYVIWAILYQREVLDFGGIVARTSYPFLPWVGVIALGYVSGLWFSNASTPENRQKTLLKFGLIGMLSFILIRGINVYGDFAWINTGEFSTTLMSFLALTKYPPSFMFSLSMLSLGILFLYFFDKNDQSKFTKIMSHFGAAPMFYYIFHLAFLRILYLIGITIYGPNEGKYLSFPSVGYIWLSFVLFTVILYFPTKWFADFKKRNRHIAWLKYF